MDNMMLIALLPIAIGAVLYVAQAVGYTVILHRPGMAVAFIGYAIANGGLIYDALTTVNK